MKPIALVGIILIGLGAVVLAYHGITFTRHKKIIDVGPLQATVETKKTIPVTPEVGAIALAGGIVLLVIGAKKKRR
jgi:hypothetical protein